MVRWVRCGVLLAALLSVVATGCLAGEVDLSVKADGGGVFTMEVFPPGTTRAPLRDLDISQLLGKAVGIHSGDGSPKVTSVKVDGQTGYRVSIPFENALELNDRLDSPVTVGAHQVSLFSDFELTKETGSDSWRLDATINSIAQIFVPLSGDPTYAAVVNAAEPDAGQPVPSADMTFTLALPGDMVFSNAEERGSKSATWKITDTSVPTVITARSEPGGFPTTLQKALLTGSSVIVVGLILILLSKRSSRSHMVKRMKRSERKAAKARTNEASGWGPKGPGALPNVPHPTTNIGRRLPGVGETPAMPQAEPGSYDPVRGMRAGQSTPTQPPAVTAAASPAVPQEQAVEQDPVVETEVEQASLADEPDGEPVFVLEFSKAAAEAPVVQSLEPVSDEEVAAAVVEAFGIGTQGGSRGPAFSPGHLTDHDIAEAVFEAVSTADPATAADDEEVDIRDQSPNAETSGLDAEPEAGFSASGER